MERADERLTTRDIASPSSADERPRFEREDREPTTEVRAPPTGRPGGDDDARRRAASAPRADGRRPRATGDDADRARRRRAGVRAAEPERETTATDRDPADTAGTGPTPPDGTPTATPRRSSPTARASSRAGRRSRCASSTSRAARSRTPTRSSATVMQRLAEGFAQERERLEGQWGRGEDISTEDLRVALQRYRSFFQRLLVDLTDCRPGGRQ